VIIRPAFVLLAITALHAQTPSGLTLTQAVDTALKNYPAIRVTDEQIQAAAAGITLARTAYLPRVDALAQANRATRNNVFGLLLPQSTIPSMSGPVLGTNNLGTAWGSALGVLATWEPFDFGLRQANVEAASAARHQAEAARKRTEFEIAASTADAYLTLAAAQESAQAAQAAVDRADVILRSITALTNAELRPGADRSRAEAELAAARTQVAQAQQAVDIARVTISQFTGVEAARISLAAPSLAKLPDPRPETAPAISANPIAAEQDAVIENEKARLHALERAYFPKFYLQGAAYARGTGAEVNGTNLGGVNGLAPNTQNYALGFTVVFPAMDKQADAAREAVQSANVRVQQAKARQIAVDLRAQWDRAVAALEGARRIAANTPAQISAARAALEQSRARYDTGLGAIDAVAEAQRLLAQAEIDDALARLSVWRGLLAVSVAAGDIRPFAAEVDR
jgi:outer membrane protein TolC